MSIFRKQNERNLLFEHSRQNKLPDLFSLYFFLLSYRLDFENYKHFIWFFLCTNMLHVCILFLFDFLLLSNILVFSQIVNVLTRHSYSFCDEVNICTFLTDHFDFFLQKIFFFSNIKDLLVNIFQTSTIIRFLSSDLLC